MTTETEQLSMHARRAVQAQDWPTVARCAQTILQHDASSAEGWFLAGLVERIQKRPLKAIEAFERALELDETRYDAAVELANQYSIARRNGDAAALLARYEARLDNSPMYLDLAGTIYTEIGLPQKAWPLYEKAVELQPGVDLFQANLAACAVFIGEIDVAKRTFRSLLERFPNHQRNHWQLARLEKARDDAHVREMQAVLERSDGPPARNIYLYYAIGKELEDLERWDEAFDFYEKAGDAVCSVAEYDVRADVELLDTIIETCDREWLENKAAPEPAGALAGGRTPIFVVGLPRTGTTLTERIISSHSEAQSLGETQFLQMVLRRESSVQSVEKMTPEMVEAVAGTDMSRIAEGYMEAVGYRLGPEPYFIDKLPFNFQYLGFIARAWPEARMVSLVRHPMDACFSMYKQVFTWAYKFSYDLRSLAAYYVAYDRMRRHWQDVLGDRLIEVRYEDLVSDQENQTRRLLERLGLPFEEACLHFDRNRAPTATASNVQVREKVHDRSVGRWRHFERRLEPLRKALEDAGIDVA